MSSSQEPDDLSPDARRLAERGHGLAEAGVLDSALDAYDRALALAPLSGELHFYRAGLLHQMGRPDEALAGFDRSIALEPRAVIAHLSKSGALMTLGRPAEALVVYDDLLAGFPDLALAWSNRADTLRTLDRPREAADSAQRAIALDPADPYAHLNRGAALLDLSDFAGALESYDAAIALRPGKAAAHANRATALRGLERFDEALAAADRAVALDPALSQARHNRATVLADMGRYPEAKGEYAAARRLAPEAALPTVGAACTHLALGEFDPGWALMEQRWAAGDPSALMRPRDIVQPVWRGEPVAGKTVLVRGEQGLGDVIQFCRYAPLIQARGARVILEVQPALKTLMASLAGVDRVVLSTDDVLPPFDLYCPVMSLPLAFGTTVATIPADVPYLAAPADKVRQWRERLGERRRPRIGLVWSGGHRPYLPVVHAASIRRNAPLAALAPLAAIDADFHSLQKGEAAQAQLHALQASGWSGPAIVDHASELTDLSDTAALIENLDAVVSVCTSVAHLSGALGKPTIILLQSHACWRWMTERTDTPWYPTAELLRQPSWGDWSGVIGPLVTRLAALTSVSAAP